MDGCNDIRARLALYLDDELEGGERASFESHLHNCERCNSVVNAERAFVDAVRLASPLYLASDSLRARVTQVINEAPPVVVAPPSLRQRIQANLAQFSTTHHAPAVNWSSVVIAAFVILVLPVAIWMIISYGKAGPAAAGPSTFALMAADTHLRHTRGQLPLEIVSSGPEQISTWFANKVSFSVKLPNYQDSSGQEKLYRLEGARLVGYKDDYAAYVAYQMRTRPISLVITSTAIAQPAGGEQIQAKGLTFHYDAIQGLKVITWSDRGLTYALVSDLDERGQESCVVCHQGAKDQDFIAPLKPR
jgi:anti-sigma factor RsiW